MIGGDLGNHELTGAIVGATIGITSAMAEQNESFAHVVRQISARNAANIDQANEIINDLTAKIRTLLRELDAEQCHSAGLEAYIELIRQTSPDISALSASGQKFADGSSKSNATLAYEDGYDKLAIEKGLPELISMRAR